MSVRALNAELGLSHETISQRFGSKQTLYFAAVEFGVAEFNATFADARSTWPAEVEGLEELRATIHSFVTAAGQHPEIGRLVNQEGAEDGDRLDHLLAAVLRPGADALVALIRRLIGTGEIRSISARELFFLCQAGAAPFNLPRLSAVFDDVDGPLDRDAHISSVTETIIEGIRRR
jgi:AcrR family transcriptional regulator